jgi:hypothetical protein
MKSFNYTARDKAGGMKRGSLQAADRNAALHELVAQGMVTLSITEGATKKTSGFSNLKPFIVAGGIAVVLGGVFFLLQLMPKNLAGMATNKPKKVQGLQQTEKQTDVAGQEMSHTMGAVLKGKREEATKENLDRKIKIATQPAATNLSMDVAITNAPPPMYTSQTEAYLHAIFNTELGNSPPRYLPLPRKENIMAIVERDILIYDTDTDADIQQKAQVAQAKKILKEYLEKGGDKQDFVDFYYKELEVAHADRLDGLNQMRTLYATGDEEGAMRFMEDKNKTFAEKGIKLLKRPFTWDIK